MAAPSITSFTPTTGPVGTTVTVSGSGFTGVTGVTLGGATAAFTIVSGTSLMFTVPNLAAGAATLALSYVDTVVDPTGFTVTGSTAPQVPNPPTGLAASDITETGFTLAWVANTSGPAATQFTPQLNGSDLAAVSGTSAAISGLTAGTTYTMTVIASNTAGDSMPSKALSVTTTGSTVPPPPAPSSNELPLVLAGAGALALVALVLMRRPANRR